jgi:hypothetical protein
LECKPQIAAVGSLTGGSRRQMLASCGRPTHDWRSGAGKRGIPVLEQAGRGGLATVSPSSTSDRDMRIVAAAVLIYLLGLAWFYPATTLNTDEVSYLELAYAFSKGSACIDQISALGGGPDCKQSRFLPGTSAAMAPKGQAPSRRARSRRLLLQTRLSVGEQVPGILLQSCCKQAQHSRLSRKHHGPEKLRR